MNQIKIGKFIAQLRKEKKLTQEQLAEILGINNRSISRWETGKTMPDLSLFQPLCKALDITINELLEGERLSTKALPQNDQKIYQAIDYNEAKNLKKELCYHTFIILFGIFIFIMTLSIMPGAINFITWYSILGTYILLIVTASLIKFIIDKHQKTKYLILIASTFFILFFLMLYLIDFINVYANNSYPQINTIPHFTEEATVYDATLYDVYDCEPNNPHNKLLIKINYHNIHDIYDNITKYCMK